ncbi:MAG: T9SS type A sorting domain-containing protein [Chitinophagaceae bacterium]|nr:T9SS type A sorting domain-containing protein [Chitinophagaceae bacterium]
MRNFFIGAIALTSLLFFAQCAEHKEKKTEAELLYETEEAENEDGIKEAMEMDFEMTRDPKLGYVPAFRLVKAYNDIYMERRAGRYAARTSALTWVERGPNTNTIGPSNGNIRGPGPGIPAVSGRMRAIHIDLNDATGKTVWAASVSGGLWKTNDITASPASWTLVNDFFGNLAITSICQNPVNKNIMYFATGERNGNFDAVRGGGIWQSTNGGATWNLLANTINFWNVSKIVCDAAGNVYVGTNGANNFGLQRSVNSGISWVNITPANVNNSTRITDIKLSSTGRLHVTLSGTGEAGSYYTDNPSTVDQATWNAPLTPIPGLAANCEIAVAGNTLYALPEDANARTAQIYKSTDGGDNWVPTLTTPPSPAAEPTINQGQAWFNLAIGIDPSNPNVVIAGGLNFYRTTDGGNTWTQITRWVHVPSQGSFNYVHADHHGVFWTPNYVLVATDGGIFYSNNNGVSYTDRNIGIRTLQFYSCALHPSLNYYLGGAQDNGSHSLTSSGPITGSIEVHGGDGGFTHIDQDEPQFQFSATTNSNYRRSTDNGVSWVSVNQTPTVGQFINPTEYDDMNNRMYCSGSPGTYTLWENPQSGNTFTVISIAGATANSIRSFKVSPFTSNRVFMGSAGGAILRVDNANTGLPSVTNITGASMPQVNGNIVSSINTGTNDNFLIATYSNYGLQKVWVTANAGTSWINVSGNLPDIPVRWAMFYPEDNTKAIIATEMGIFETDNLNGASTVWVQNGSFPSVKTNMLQYRNSDGTILAATHGRGFFTTQVPPAAPYVRFGSAYNYSRSYTETANTTVGCRSYRDYTLNMLIDAAPDGDANVTLAIAGGNTATEGIDFDITTNGNFSSPSKQLTFTNGTNVPRPVTIRIYDDVERELGESFTLTYTIAGGTNAVAAPSSLSYTVNIADNDFTPVAPAPGFATTGSGDFGGYIQPFRGSFAKARSQYIYTAQELTAAGVLPGNLTSIGFNVISKGSTQPYTSLNISLKNTTTATFTTGFETGTTLCYSNASYSTVTGVNTLNFNVSNFNWDGVSNLLVEICYDNSIGTADDNVSSNITADQKSLWGRTQTGPPAGCDITTGLFSNVGGTFVRPDIILNTIVGNFIETVLNRTSTSFVGGNGSYFFNSQGTTNIIASINAATANLGCVTFSIFEAGNTWQNYFAGQRSQKVFDVQVSTNPTATYTIGLYYTLAELGGKTPGALNIARTTAATTAGANSTNTFIFPATFTAYGSGYLYTATVSGSGKFFLTEGFATSVTDAGNRMGNLVRLLQNPVQNVINLKIDNERRVNITATLFTVSGQTIKSWNLGKATGNTGLPLDAKIANGSYLLRVNAGDQVKTFKIIKQ